MNAWQSLSQFYKTLITLLAGTLLGMAVGLGGVAGLSATWPSFETAITDLRSPISVGKPAPNFTLNTLDGKKRSLSDSRGKLVLINFWATWCDPCKAEMPLIEEAYQAYEGNLEVLAINAGEPEKTVLDFVARNELHFPVLLDPESKIQEEYLVRGFPTTILVDAKGKIAVVHVGMITRPILESYLEDLGVTK